jgi:hypothetical protein
MKQTSAEVLAFPSPQKTRKMSNRIDNDNVQWIVRSNGHAHEDVLPVSKDVLCGICGRGKHERHLIIAGHTVSICSECFASFNDI